jgi:hypothetical protein
MRKITVRLDKEQSSISMPTIAVVGTHMGKEVTCYCASFEEAQVFARSVEDFHIYSVKTHKRLL